MCGGNCSLSFIATIVSLQAKREDKQLGDVTASFIPNPQQVREGTSQVSQVSEYKCSTIDKADAMHAI